MFLDHLNSLPPRVKKKLLLWLLWDAFFWHGLGPLVPLDHCILWWDISILMRGWQRPHPMPPNTSNHFVSYFHRCWSYCSLCVCVRVRACARVCVFDHSVLCDVQGTLPRNHHSKGGSEDTEEAVVFGGLQHIQQWGGRRLLGSHPKPELC